MISRRKKGFGTYEMLTICVVLLIIFVVLLANVFKTDYTEKYRVMRYNAKMFSLSVDSVRLDDDSNSVFYLKMLIDQKLSSKIKNPFQGDKFCNSYFSKVEIKDNHRYVTLECGNYLIYQQDSLRSPYTIYQVSNWSLKKGSSDNQSVIFYNYQRDGVDVFDQFLEEDIFLYEFNKMNHTEYQNISEIPDEYSIVKTTMYRYMKKLSN